MDRRSTYRTSGMFMLRRPALPFDDLEETTGPELDVDRLVDSFRCGDRAKALAVASESLMTQLRDVVDAAEQGGSGRAVDGIAHALAKYVARMSTRSTPFGACAGLTIGSFSTNVSTSGLRPELATRVRPDSGWLLQFAKQAEQKALASNVVPLRLNDLLTFEGAYATLPALDVHGEGDGRRARLRRTAALDLVLAGARDAKSAEDIVANLLAGFPAADPERATGVVQDLLDINVLLSRLRPHLTVDSPARALAEMLMDHPSTESDGEALLRLLKLTDALEHASQPDEFVASLDEARAYQATVLPGYDGPLLQVDASLVGAAPTMPAAVGREVAAAADTLLRLQGAQPDQQPHLTRYRRLFEQRFGVGVHVPVTEVLSPVVGIDAPETYGDPARTWGIDDSYPVMRDEANPGVRAICELAAEGLTRGDGQVELTDPWLDRLSPRPPRGRPFPVVDVYAEVQAHDEHALAAGDWTLVLKTHGTALGGRTFGRFGWILDDAHRAEVLELARLEEAARPDAVHAEVSFMPRFGRGGNVVVRPLVRDYEIPVNVAPSAPPDRVLDVRDVDLSSDGERLYLWHRLLDREVVVTQHHMLTLDGAPNVCRLMVEVSQQGWTVPRGFDWGPMSSAPRLPRVTRGRTVLRVAQWNVPKTVVAGASSNDERRSRLRRWLAEHGAPEHVHVVEEDNRIPVRLGSAFGDDVVLRALARARRVITLDEMLPTLGSRWLRDVDGRAYGAEIVVPVLAQRPRGANDVRPPVASGTRRDVVERFPPSSEWTYLKVFVGAEEQDAFVAHELLPLADRLLAQRTAVEWFYIRYADPDPDLRVRVRATPGSEQALVAEMLAWARAHVDSSVARDVTLETYVRETARYGGSDAIPFAESFFTANSRVTAELLAAVLAGDAPEPRHLLVVAACDALMSQWGLSHADKLRLIPSNRESDQARRLLGAHRARLRTLLDPQDEGEDPAARSQRDVVHAALAAQRDAVVTLADRLRDLEASGRLVGTVDEIVQSLCHMQVNRLMPSGGADEADCYALWRRTLLAIDGARSAERRRRGGDLS
jgi:thiopeptide-type bacteriocin biosynthesis protein